MIVVVSWRALRVNRNWWFQFGDELVGVNYGPYGLMVYIYQWWL